MSSAKATGAASKKSTKKKACQKTVSKKQAGEMVESGVRKIRPADVERVLDKSDVIQDKVRNAGPLRRFLADVKVMFGMVADYWNGKYREVPFWTIGAVVFALLYVLSPLDLIPDFIPVVGYLDDAAVVSACLAMVREDIVKYKDWKSKQPE